MFKKLSRSRSSRRRPTHRPRRFETLERRNLLTFIAQIGGDGYDYHTSTAIDGAGNTYVGGRFAGTADFDPTDDGIYELTSQFGTAFVAKYDPNGAILWARAFDVEGVGKGKSSDHPFSTTAGITLDDAGGVYIIGNFRQNIKLSSDGSFVPSAGETDVFVAKLDSSDNGGGQTLWAHTIGGSGYDTGRDLAFSEGYLYSIGEFDGIVDFDPGDGFRPLGQNNSNLGFVLSIDSYGNFSHAWSLGGNRAELLREVLIDEGNVFVTGYFAGTADFDPGENTEESRTSIGNVDLFFASYTTDGALNWVQSIGQTDGSSFEQSLAVDQFGLYVGFTFTGSTIDLDPSTDTSEFTSSGHRTSYVARYTKGEGLLDAQFTPKQFAGSTDSDDVNLRGGLMLDSAGNLYIGLTYNGTVDIDPGFNVVSPPTASYESALLKLDASGNYFKHWHSQAEDSKPVGVIDDTLYVTGNFSGTATFPTGDTLTEFGGNGDLYLLGLDVGPPPAPSFSVNDVEVIEGDVGTVIAEFTVTRSGDPSVEVSVDVSTTDGTATTDDGDYVAVDTTTLVFAPGEISHTVSVTVNGDVVEEGNETFFLNLANATGGATIADARGVGTILDDDSVIPTIHVADLDATASPGSRGKWNATITVTVADSFGQAITGVGVTVVGFWSDDPSTPVIVTTDPSTGQATITNSNINKNTSSVSFTISSLSLTGFVYDPAANEDPDGDSDGTVIQVLKP